MFFEQRAGFGDRVDQGVGGAVIDEVTPHFGGDVVPEGLSAAGVNAGVSDDRELVRARGAMKISTPLASSVAVMPICSNCFCAAETGSSTSDSET